MLEKEKLLNLLEEKKFNAIKSYLKTKNEADIAELIEELDEAYRVIIFRLLSKEMSSEVFSLLNSKIQLELFNSIKKKEMEKILDDLCFDDKIDFLEELPSKTINELIKNSTPEERNLINKFLKFPENSAGSLLTIEYLNFFKNITVSKALQQIKKTGQSKETIYIGYVLDKSDKLEGVVSLKDLVLAEETKTIEEIMDKEVTVVNAHDDQEKVAELFKKYDFLALPVVDNENHMLGIITIDDIVDVIDEEATEDLYRMNAQEPTDGSEYFNTSAVTFFRKRILWLMILMGSEIMTGLIISKYHKAIESVVLLAAMIPMLMDNGGNAGSQSSVSVIRGMALGEIKTSDFFRVLKKELSISLMLSSTLAIFTFVRLLFFMHYHFAFALTVSLTIIFTLLVANFLGGFFPVLLTKLKIDPALLAGPAICTVLDSVTLLIYFGLATLILKC